MISRQFLIVLLWGLLALTFLPLLVLAYGGQPALMIPDAWILAACFTMAAGIVYCILRSR